MTGCGAERAMRWRAAAAALTLAASVGRAQTGGPATEHFRYERVVSGVAAGLNCAVVDPAIYEKAAPSLGDLRLYERGGEAVVPFVLTQSGTAGGDVAEATVTGVEQREKALEFDLHMPARAYTDVVLQMEGQGFVAEAEVSAEEGGRRADLGRFGIFDLRAQGLGESTVLHLEETSAPVLHVRLQPLPGSTALLPGMVRGAAVPPSREAQTLFTPAVRTTEFAERGGATVATLRLPERVPIERVQVVLKKGFSGNFDRSVRVQSRAVGQPASEAETVTGTIARVHLQRGGVTLEEQRLTVPATLGANLQGPAEVEVDVENHGQPPLPLAAVVLEMRERRICFVATAPRDEVLLYGDATLKPATYELPRGLMGQTAHVATMGPAQENPGYVARVERRSLRARHPRLVYLSLAIGVCVLGLLTLRSTKLRV